MKGKGVEQYQFAISISPLDCMGCTLCVKACPSKNKALEMVPQESQLEEQKVWNYMVNNVSKEGNIFLRLYNQRKPVQSAIT